MGWARIEPGSPSSQAEVQTTAQSYHCLNLHSEERFSFLRRHIIVARCICSVHTISDDLFKGGATKHLGVHITLSYNVACVTKDRKLY